MNIAQASIKPIGIPNITLVSSGKGGVGKTWFSVTYANALAQKGKKVLLFDGDLGLANVDIQVGLMPERDLGNYINKECSLRECITSYEEGGFDIIAGRSGCANFSSIPLSRLEVLQHDLAELAKDYDYIILDMGAGLEQTVRQLSSLAGQCMIIATNEPTSLTDAYAFIKYSRMAVPNLKISIVINMASTETSGMKAYNTLLTVCKNFLNYSPELAGIIPRDKGVPDAIRNQKPLFIRFPHCDAASEIRKITDAVSRG